MTPTAVTPAARTKRSGGSPPKSPRGTPARPSSPHPSSPRAARRAPLARSTVPRAPRRVSGPAAPTRAPTPTAPSRSPRAPRRAARPAGLPLSARAVATLRTLPDHALLDRVVRGRLWIPLLGILLAGIVAMQVEVLKLNASIGHAVVRSGQLQAANQLLRADLSRLGDDQRVEREAESMGMSMPPATAPLYLGGSATQNLSHALANIHAPDPAAFAAQSSQLAAARAAAVISSSGQ